MGIIEVTIPQLGEGLHEARIIRLLKAPGDLIRRDEPIFEMETDKAIMEIESPAAGRLQTWLSSPDDVVPIGAVVAHIEVDVDSPADGIVRHDPPSTCEEDTAGMAAPAIEVRRAARNVAIPPRTRAYGRDLGLTDDDLTVIAEAIGGKVLPADIDRWLQQPRVEGKPASDADITEEVELSPAQRTLVFRLEQRAAEVIPATEEIRIPWEPIDRVRIALKPKARDIRLPVTPFLIFAWCAARAVEDCPLFRCTLGKDGVVRRYPRLSLGLAVTRGDDELLTALVPEADAVSFGTFVQRSVEAIKRARSGHDQAAEGIQVSISNLAGLDIHRAIPIVVPPAIATIYVGEVYLAPVGTSDRVRYERMANVALTFDHRVVNGVGAARYLAAIRRRVAALSVESLMEE